MKLLVFTFLAFFSYQSEALVEARIHYGTDITKTQKDDPNNIKLGRTHSLGVDALVKPPLFPLGIGLRYSMLGANDKDKRISESGWTAKASFKNLAILANYRIIDAGFFLGAVGTLGILHSAKIKQEGTEDSTFESKKTSSYSIGVEGGLPLADKVLGGIELGYYFSKFTELSDLDSLSKVYAKAFIGMSF